MQKAYMVYDMGGTSIKTAVMSKDGTILQNGKIDTGTDFESCFALMEQELAVAKQTYDVLGVAISAPGAVDTATGIIGGASALPFIHGPNWKEEWQERTGYEIAIENDASCAALSELYFGNAQQTEDFAYVVIGTGIGGAVVVDNEIVTGANIHGGEFGYIFLPHKLDASYRSWSALGSSVATSRIYNKLYPETPKTTIEIFEAAEAGDVACQEAVDNFYLYNALGIWSIQFTVDSSLILIGGGISRRADFMVRLQEKLDYLQEQSEAKPRPKVQVGRFLDDANLYGALANLLHK